MSERATVIFLSEEEPVSCQDNVFYRRSMYEWAIAVLGECSHLEQNPRALSIVWTKSDGIWHRF